MLIITIKVNILLETFKKYLQLNYDDNQHRVKGLGYSQQEKSPLRQQAENGDFTGVWPHSLCLLPFSSSGMERKGMWDFVTEFEGVWWKAQSLRRIDSSNVTSNLKLTDRMEGFFGSKEKANQ